MGIPDHLSCLLRNLYAGQEATVRTGHDHSVWSQGKPATRQPLEGAKIGLDLFQSPILGKVLFDLSGSFWEDPIYTVFFY